MENTACSRRKSHFHEIFSCPFGHFVVQKEFVAYPGSLTPYAEEMLLQTHNSISDIAMMSGFRSLLQFNRTFKSITGISPREFRKTKPKPEARLIF